MKKNLLVFVCAALALCPICAYSDENDPISGFFDFERENTTVPASGVINLNSNNPNYKYELAADGAHGSVMRLTSDSSAQMEIRRIYQNAVCSDIPFEVKALVKIEMPAQPRNVGVGFNLICGVTSGGSGNWGDSGVTKILTSVFMNGDANGNNTVKFDSSTGGGWQYGKWYELGLRLSANWRYIEAYVKEEGAADYVYFSNALYNGAIPKEFSSNYNCFNVILSMNGDSGANGKAYSVCFDDISYAKTGPPEQLYKSLEIDYNFNDIVFGAYSDGAAGTIGGTGSLREWKYTAGSGFEIGPVQLNPTEAGNNAVRLSAGAGNASGIYIDKPLSGLEQPVRANFKLGIPALSAGTSAEAYMSFAGLSKTVDPAKYSIASLDAGRNIFLFGSDSGIAWEADNLYSFTALYDYKNRLFKMFLLDGADILTIADYAESSAFPQDIFIDGAGSRAYFGRFGINIAVAAGSGQIYFDDFNMDVKHKFALIGVQKPVRPAEPIIAMFNEYLDVSSFPAVSLADSADESVNAGFYISGKNLVIVPDAPLGYNSAYTLAVSGAYDALGISLPPFSSRFLTINRVEIKGLTLNGSAEDALSENNLLEVKVKSNEETGCKVVFTAVLYDKNTYELLASFSAEAEAGLDETKISLPCALPPDTDLSKVRLYAYLWDGFDTMAPYCSPVIFR
jgi:hypothetical protein